jgi:hypothetical protein
MALDAMWDDMAYKGYNTIEDVKARLAATIWPQKLAAIVVYTPPHSDTESEGVKRGRKKGPMSPEAKALMVAKRAATLAAKVAKASLEKVAAERGVEPEALHAALNLPVLTATAPKAVKAVKVKAEKPAKLTKEERSAAAKARYQALSEEAKAAIRDRMVTARAANKAKKAEILKARANANEED